MRTFSDNATTSLLQRVTSELWLVFLTMKIDQYTHYLVAGSMDPVISNGQQFEPYAFDIVLPSESIDSIDQVSLVIDNVDRSLMDGLRAASDPLEFTIQIALLSQPDVIELELNNLFAQQIEFDAQTISATLILDDIWNQKFPGVGEQYDSVQFPRLF